MGDFEKEHLDYLNSSEIPFHDKKEFYENYAKQLQELDDANHANSLWMKITSVLAYCENLTTMQKTLITPLYKHRGAGHVSGSQVIRRFEIEQNTSTEIIQSFLNTYEMRDIIKARDLAFAFIAATQGEELMDTIYRIAEATYVEKNPKLDRRGASRAAYNVFVMLLQSPLVTPEDQDKYMQIAREVYLDYES